MYLTKLFFYVSTFFIFTICFHDHLYAQSDIEEFNIRKGKDFALLIGIDQYTDSLITDLEHPINEIKALAKELEEVYGFQVDTLFNPTREAIQNQIKALRHKQFDKDAQLLIFLSGHGARDDSETLQGYFYPSDAKRGDFNSSIGYNLLTRWVDDINCKHILLGVDACFSGLLEKAASRSVEEDIKRKPRPGEDPCIPKNKVRILLKDKLRYKSRIFMTSGGNERTPAKSEFMERFLVALRGSTYKDPLVDFSNDVRRELERVSKSAPRIGEFGPPPPAGITHEFVFVRNKIACGEGWREPVEQTRRINGKAFYMSSDSGESDEKKHRVTVSDFYIASHEVTVGEFKEFVDSTGYVTDAEKSQFVASLNKRAKGSAIVVDGVFRWRDNINWRHDEVGQLRSEEEYNYPVIHVSWNDAIAYCNWLSKQNKLTPAYTLRVGQNPKFNPQANGYRLPTEAEWEFAAKANVYNTKWSGVLDEYEFTDYANGNIEGDDFRFTAPVTSLRYNEFKLYDMTGNVSEWVWDIYQYDYFSTSSKTKNPRGGMGSYRVYKGGSWFDKELYNLRISNRFNSPAHERNPIIGFRVARNATRN